MVWPFGKNRGKEEAAVAELSKAAAELLELEKEEDTLLKDLHAIMGKVYSLAFRKKQFLKKQNSKIPYPGVRDAKLHRKMSRINELMKYLTAPGAFAFEVRNPPSEEAFRTKVLTKLHELMDNYNKQFRLIHIIKVDVKRGVAA